MICVHKGKRTGGELEQGRDEVSRCINFSFRGKMCLPGDWGLSVPGWTTRNQVSPFNIQAALCSVITFTQDQDTYAHCVSTCLGDSALT